MLLLSELGYKNIDKGRYFIFISLFSIIIFNNFLGLFPYVFTTTRPLTRLVYIATYFSVYFRGDNMLFKKMK